MRKRRTNRSKRRKQKNIIIVTSLSFILFLTVGYAAFSTNISLKAKGNIKDYNAAWQLKKNIVTSGDGLYTDIYENGRFVFRGQDPNNYIRFNDELWRIIAIENDESLKIIKQKSIGQMTWDNKNSRNNDNNTYCNRKVEYNGTTNYWGCNAWSATDGNFINGTYSGTVTTDSDLNIFLNNEYYNNLNDDKKYIVTHDFYVGNKCSNDEPIETRWRLEKSKIWNGRVALMNVSDFLKASTNPKCTTQNFSRSSEAPCTLEKGNYLDENKQETWTINMYSSESVLATSGIATVSAYFIHPVEGQLKGCVSGTFSISNYLVRPVVFLSSDIKLTGEGTADNPYIIK